MKLIFPENFFFGTSTSAEQIETAFQHDWQGITAKDNYTFDRTTDHELRMNEDIDLIASLSTHYRMSLMWSRLQRAPYAKLDPDATAHYHTLLGKLRQKKVKIMLVLHHFVNPTWFSASGGWANKKNVDVWLDYAQKVIHEFGDYATYWNTFNEPNLYSTLGFVLGEFPPFRKNLIVAIDVIRNMGQAHDRVYDVLKSRHPDKLIGISHNCAVFKGQNAIGKIPAKLADLLYMEFFPKHFMRSDFIGLSYYACISFDPQPITQLYTPEKINKHGKRSDDIWEYYPEGLGECIERYWRQYNKPVIITENGFCTNDDTKRVLAIKDYAQVLHKSLAKKIAVLGYFHWSTWDNFEWTLGPTYRFGLYELDLKTMERKIKKSGELYSLLSFTKEVEI